MIRAPTVRRMRRFRLRRIHCMGEPIADAEDSEDEPRTRPVGLELSPKIHDVASIVRSSASASSLSTCSTSSERVNVRPEPSS